MTDEELGRLAILLCTIADLRGVPRPSRTALAVFAKVLEPYPYAIIEKATYAHLASQAGVFTTELQPGDITAEIRLLLRSAPPTAPSPAPLPAGADVSGSAHLQALKDMLRTGQANDPTRRQHGNPSD